MKAVNLYQNEFNLLSNMIVSSNSLDELHSVLRNAKSTLPINNGVINFYLHEYFTALAVLSFITIVLGFIYYNYTVNLLYIGIFFIVFLMLIALISVHLFYKLRNIKLITKCAYKKMLNLKYSISENSSLKKEILQKRFKFFPSGDRYNGFRYCFNSYMGGIKHKIFEYYYEIESTSHSTDSDGKTSTSKNYTTHSVNGIFFSKSRLPAISFGFGWLVNKKLWSPTSPDFNKKYKIFVGKDHDLAKYFTPQRVKKIVDISTELPRSFKIEVSKKRMACVSFQETNLMRANSKISSLHYDKFIEYVERNQHFSRYYDLIKTLEKVFKITEYEGVGN